jgi:hypothetical protein
MPRFNFRLPIAKCQFKNFVESLDSRPQMAIGNWPLAIENRNRSCDDQLTFRAALHSAQGHTSRKNAHE